MDRKEACVAILWLCLLATSSARDVDIKGLEMICVSSNVIVQSSRHLLQSRFFSLPPPSTERGRIKTRRFLRPAFTLVDPSQVSVLGWVDREKAVKKSKTPAGKKKRTDDSLKPSSKKSKSSNKRRSGEIRDLDEKWGECFTKLEAVLLSKMFPVHMEPVKKPSSVVTSDQPFLDPGTSNTGLSSAVTVGGASPSLAQTTGEAVFVSESSQ